MKKFIMIPFMALAAMTSVAHSKPSVEEMADGSIFHIHGRDTYLRICRISKNNGVYIMCNEFEGNKSLGTPEVTPVKIDCRKKFYTLGNQKEKEELLDYSDRHLVSTATAFSFNLYRAACKNDYSVMKEEGDRPHGDHHIGRWGNVAYKGSCGRHSDAFIEITRKSVNRYEDLCKVSKWIPKKNGYTYTGTCTNEGDSYKPSDLFRMIGDNFLVDYKPNGFSEVYVRCSK